MIIVVQYVTTFINTRITL